MTRGIAVSVCHVADGGAASGGVRERDIGQAVTRALRDRLAELGASPIYVETPLAETINEIRSIAPSCCVEIHCDAGGGDHGETLHSATVPAGADTPSTRLCATLGTALAGVVPWPVRGPFPGCPPHTAHDHLGYLEHTPCPAAIVELGFIDRETHRLMLTSPVCHAAIAVAFADALIAWVASEAGPNSSPAKAVVADPDSGSSIRG